MVVQMGSTDPAIKAQHRWLSELDKRITKLEKRQDRIEKLTGLPIGKEE